MMQPQLCFLHINYLKKETLWNWSNTWRKACDKIKTILSSDKVLVHYNVNLPLKLTVDASPYGVSAILSHICENNIEKPIAYASKV